MQVLGDLAFAPTFHFHGMQPSDNLDVSHLVQLLLPYTSVFSRPSLRERMYEMVSFCVIKGPELVSL